MHFLRKLRLPVILLGLVLTFVGERYFGADSVGIGLLGSGIALISLGVILNFLMRYHAQQKGHAEEVKSWTFLFLWQGLVFGALVFYLIYSRQLSDSGIPELFLDKLLLSIWLTLAVLGLFLAAGSELAMHKSGKGASAESKRVVRAGSSWVLAGILLGTLVCINFAANQKNKAFDWSYLKATTPSISTIELVKASDKNLEIAVFYDVQNEVRPFVYQYFQEISSKQPALKVSFLDKDLNPTQAEAFKVAKNGQVILAYDGKRERISIGTDLKSARSKLKKLDGEFQKAFLSLTTAKKRIFFTSGHGELSAQNARIPQRSIKLFQSFLRDRNYVVRTLDAAEGATQSIPEDAEVIAIIGATKPFLDGEVEALKAFLEKGGKLLVLLDVEKTSQDGQLIQADQGDPLRKLLNEIGIEFQDTYIANETKFIAGTRSPVDRWFLFHNTFTTHESVSSLAKNDEKVAVITFQSGYLKLTKEGKKWRTQPTIKSLTNTFTDINKNFKFDKDSETEASFDIAAVSTKGESRVVVASDATLASDILLRNTGNILYLSDAIKWLSGKVEGFGTASSEEDIRIRHTRAEDTLKFYATVVFVPLLVLLIGRIMVRRKPRKKV